MRDPCRTLLLVLLMLGSAACTSSFGEGVRQYDHGRYPEALEQLRQTETEARAFRERDRARYALYRGLTHLALGNRSATMYWLAQVKRAVEANPTLLGDFDSGRLTSAWSH